MGLTDKRALDEIQKLFDMCFDTNSFCDRLVYVLSINYNMIKFADWFHHSIAHAFPEFADKIEAFGELRGDLFHRGMVPAHTEEYESVSDGMNLFAIKVAELENQCVVALKASAEFGAESYEDFLRDFNIKNIVPMLKQSMVLYNQIKAYEDDMDLHKWNKDFGAWIIPEFGGD